MLSASFTSGWISTGSFRPGSFRRRAGVRSQGLMNDASKTTIKRALCPPGLEFGVDHAPRPRGGIRLERRTRMAYCPAMDDTPRHRQSADLNPPMPTEAELLAVLVESEADIAAGRLVPGEVVHGELRASIARLEAKGRAKEAAKPR